jgi:hypothetical protein
VIVCPICQAEYEGLDGFFCGECGADLRGASPVSAADDWIGRVVDGRYRVQARVGTGGMGAVYRVEHVRMGKLAAMKVLHRALAGQPDAVTRFNREVEAISRLNHPHIVQTFDFGTWDGQCYLIMEYVEGEDLGAILDHSGPLPMARALGLARQVCSALDEAHSAGVIHCDLKPANIVCVRRRHEEHAKVLDFGLAKLRERPDRTELTGAGNLIGTPHYMSPEQVRAGRLDHRTDIYSLGATLYRALTGEVSFTGATPIEIMARHLTDDLVPPSARAPALGLPAEVDRIILRAMARDPDQRYLSAAEMREDIEALSPGERSLTPGSSLTVTGPLNGELGAPAETAAVRPRLEEEVDAFERRQRIRRRVHAFVAAPLGLVGLICAGWAGLRLLRARPSTLEKEPNDLATLATPLPRDAPVRGYVGVSRASGEPDFDYYQIPAGPGRRAVTAKITGVPDVDLVLELCDEAGHPIIKADAAGPGEGEALGPAAIGPGGAFVRAHPLWVRGEPPVESSSTPYELTVDWGPPRADWELEPNDSPATANGVDGQSAVNGYLASAGDEDWFRVTVPAGMRVDGRVDGIDGVDLVVLVGEERRRIDAAGVGEHERFSALAGTDGTVLIGVAETAVAPGKGLRPRPERDQPYTVKLRLRSTNGASAPAIPART